ncbi:MAG TPA: peptidoglycan-binding domain-containing protein [Verrucomicrobiae bacterium]|nr:peptidoglycan-binding domain-containing protein [Verrucomicrobiae bacterium]
MQIKELLKIGAILMVFAGVSAAKSPDTKPSSKTGPSSAAKTSTKKAHHSRRSRRGAWKRRGQQQIKSDRAAEIQQALIREKYMDGTPSGVWDTRTQHAMARYQADHGWQSKITPDSRAIIKLGLGPNHAQDLGSPAVKTAPAAAAAVPAAGLVGNTPRR